MKGVKRDFKVISTTFIPHSKRLQLFFSTLVLLRRIQHFYARIYPVLPKSRIFAHLILPLFFVRQICDRNFVNSFETSVQAGQNTLFHGISWPVTCDSIQQNRLNRIAKKACLRPCYYTSKQFCTNRSAFGIRWLFDDRRIEDWIKCVQSAPPGLPSRPNFGVHRQFGQYNTESAKKDRSFPNRTQVVHQFLSRFNCLAG